MRKKATVLLPVYNSENYLKEAIESIINQTYKDFEFLIINDGSTDKSEDVIKSYDDKRIKYLKNEVNIGFVKTLNLGIDCIDSEYLIRMDADDISLPDRIQTQIDFMDNNPDIGVSSSYFELFGDENLIVKIPLLNKEIVASMLFSNPICHPASIIRMSVLKDHKVYYRPTVPVLEDYDLWYRLKSVTKFSNIDKVLLKYRRDGFGMSDENMHTLIDRKKTFFKKLLMGIGIDPTEKELLLHIGLGETSLLLTKQNVILYKTWLEKLVLKNREHHIYDIKSLRKIAERKWSQLFYKLPPSGFNTILTYWKASRYKIKAVHLLFFLKYMFNRYVLKRNDINI